MIDAEYQSSQDCSVTSCARSRLRPSELEPADHTRGSSPDRPCFSRLVWPPKSCWSSRPGSGWELKRSSALPPHSMHHPTPMNDCSEPWAPRGPGRADFDVASPASTSGYSNGSWRIKAAAPPAPSWLVMGRAWWLLMGHRSPMAIANRNCLHGSYSCFCWAFDRSAAWRPCDSTSRQFQQGF